MTARPKVSVIVPVHATAWSLRECLDSLLVQSLCDCEIIVVNDASPDAAADIIDDYARRDSRIRLLTNAANRNLFESRLRGFEAARGEFIATCDSDDVMPPRALECLYAAARKENADIVHGRSRELGGMRPGAILYDCEPFQAATGREFVASMFGNIRGWTVWGKLFSGALVRSRLGAFPRNTGWFQAEDVAYCAVFGLAAERYVGIGDVVYKYRVPDFRNIPDETSREKKIRDQIQILTFLGGVVRNEPCAHGLEQAFTGMANHVMASVFRTAPRESRNRFSDGIVQIGLESVRRPRLLSWRYHYDWIRKNGIKEYMMRLRILFTNARRVGGRKAVERILGFDP